MRSPYRCSSLRCSPPHAYCRDCSHATWRGSADVDGRRYSWEFNPRFGPDFQRRKGSPYDWVPHMRHPVWKAFERWLARLNGTKAGRTK